MELNKIYCGDSLEILKTFPDNSIDCVVTSPPYFSLRSYLPDEHHNKEKEVGFGVSPEGYIQSLVDIFREVRRILSPSGTCYLNLGDSYDKNKNLLLMPHRVALAMQGDGWIVRSDIVYHKRNCMPSSVKDRPVSSKEYVFLMAKSKSYHYNWEAISTEPSGSYAKDKRAPGILRQKFYEGSKYNEPEDESVNGAYKKQDGVDRSDYIGFNARYKSVERVRRRDVWSLPVPGNTIKHFAMMNIKLIDLCIKAGCPEGGVVLDPFMGSGSVGLVAKQLGRSYIGIELNAEYVKMAEDRIHSRIQTKSKTGRSIQ